MKVTFEQSVEYVGMISKEKLHVLTTSVEFSEAESKFLETSEMSHQYFLEREPSSHLSAKQKAMNKYIRVHPVTFIGGNDKWTSSSAIDVKHMEQQMLEGLKFFKSLTQNSAADFRAI